MRPTHLSIRGLKSWENYEVDLGPLTAFQGPNGAGKTAVIQALRLALMGYDPETGKQLTKTRQLISSPTGVTEIGVSFDTGFGIRRKFSAKSETQVMPSEGESTGAECQARIDEETGGLVIAFDLAEFLEFSDQKRQEWFFSHLPRETAELSWPIFEKWTEAKKGLEDVVLSLWENSVQAAPNPVIGLGNAIEVAHQRVLEADDVKRAQKIVAERVERVFRELEKPAEVVADAMEEAHQRVAGLNQRIGQARAGREAAENIRARASRLRDALADRESTNTSVQTSLREAREERAAASVATDVSILEKGVSEGIERERELETKISEASEATLEKKSQLTTLRISLKAVEERGPCPYTDLGCQTDLEGIKGERVAEIQGEIATAKAFFEKAQTHERTLREQLEIERKGRGLVEEEIRTSKDAAANIERLQARIADKEIRLQEMAEQIELAVAELKAAEQEEKDLQEDDGGAELYPQREEAEAQIERLQATVQEAALYAQRQQAVKDEAAELEVHTEKVDALKELDGNLKRLRAHVIQRMIEPLHQEADQILRSMDPHKRFRFVFERENRATMDFGFEQDQVLRLYDAASKGERLMLAVSFVGSLLTILKPKMRLLVIDDMEQLWPSNRRQLMDALHELRDRWDGIIVAGACDFEEPDGWQIEDLEELMPGYCPIDDEEYPEEAPFLA